MIFFLAGDVAVFAAGCLGLGLLFASLIRAPDSLDRLSLGVGTALVLLYLASFAAYLLPLPRTVFWLPVLAGPVALMFRRKARRELTADGAVSAALGRWLVLAVWCLGWQALVFSYSGARWSGDWQEHYDRAHFFLQHWPADHLFIDIYSLPARPPLANLVTSGFLGLVGGKFFHFQVIATLLATLVYFPLAGFVRRLQPGARPQALLLGLLMLSPLFVQNATFPWTKLPVAFFLVLAADFLTRTAKNTPFPFVGCALGALGAALVTHYSAAVWSIALGVAWLALNRHRLAEPAIRHQLLAGGALGALVFLTWLGWSLHAYGSHLTFSVESNAALAQPTTALGRVGRIFGNVYHTLIPAWIWDGLPEDMQTAGRLAQFRDRWFCLYQQNLPFALGVGGLAIFSRLLPAYTTRPAARFWWVAAPLLLVIIAALHVVDPLGLAHLVLAPLILLGLAWLAAHAHEVPRPWTRWWVAGLALDFTFGIVLHFGVQSLWLDRWLTPGRADIDYILQLCRPAAANYFGKLRIGAIHLADGLSPLVAGLMLATAAACAFLALRRTNSPVTPKD